VTHPRASLTVGLLHPGQMGAAVGAQARRNGVPVLWCPAGRSPQTADRAATSDLQPAADLNDLLDRADVVLSICPPAAAEEVAQAVAARSYRGIFVEANAISPARCARIAEMLNAAGARVVDGAIFGPPPTDSTSVRLYLAGDAETARVVTALFTDTAVEPVALSAKIGGASALKMAHSSYQKAARALAAVAHALAADHGVTEHLLTEANRNARSPLTDVAYLPSVAARAWRWAPEMLEVAKSLADADLPVDLAVAAAQVLNRWQDVKDDWDLQPEEAIPALHRPGAAGSPSV
jgi:3-hydroxyisobutyrate dehydrogenase-like beta-hydroxyacid dehydrogenase